MCKIPPVADFCLIKQTDRLWSDAELEKLEDMTVNYPCSRRDHPTRPTQVNKMGDVMVAGSYM